jgi:hypothetical protein
VISRRQFNGAQAHHRSYDIELVPGRKVQVVHWVGERRVGDEAAAEASRRHHTSENAGMSSERRVRNPSAE